MRDDFHFFYCCRSIASGFLDHGSLLISWLDEDDHLRDL